MKYVIHILFISVLAGCSSIPLPENGTVKKAGKTYMQHQPTLCGVPIGKPRYEEVPSKWDTLRKQLQKPAKWLLGVMLPFGIICGAVMVVGVSNPVVMKWAGFGAGIGLCSSVGAGAWLAATTSLLLLIPVVIVLLVIGYFKTKGKRLTMGAVDNA